MRARQYLVVAAFTALAAAGCASQPELIATTELRITAPNDSKDKIIGVRIGVAGVIPRKLVGDKKGSS